MNAEQWNPGSLLELSGSYWKTGTLQAAVVLDVFTAIGDGHLEGDIVSDKIRSDKKNTVRLLNALSAMSLLKKEGDVFSNTDASRRYLSRDSDSYIGYMIMHHHNLVPSWSRLDEAVRNGRPVRTRTSHDDNEARREAFLMGMFNNAMLIAPGLARELDLSGRKRLLDLGGGPGTYAIQFCLHNPELMATVFDLPTTRPFTEKTIARFKMEARVNFEGGNFVDGDIPGSYDVIWISHILHAEGEGVCQSIIKKAMGALETGGMIIIHEFILDDEKNSPLFPALFDLNMLLGTTDGRSYSESELMKMLESARAKDIKRLSFRGPNDSGIIVGVK